MDVRNPEDVERMITETKSAFKTFTISVNNAAREILFVQQKIFLSTGGELLLISF